MKKVYIPMLLLCFILLAACSSDDTEEEQGQSKEKGTEEDVHPEPESLFVQKYGEDDSFDFTGINAATNASTIIFDTKERIKRVESRQTHLVYGEKEPMSMQDLSEADEEELEDRSCRNTFVSPDGKYVTFRCVSDEDWFIVYDTEEEEIIQQVEEPEDYFTDVIGITDDLDILQYNEDDYHVSIRNAETDKIKEFDLVALSEEKDDDYFVGVRATNDGEKFLAYNYERIYLLDTEKETMEKLADVEPYQERFQDEVEDIMVGNVRFSPNGKYVFYKIGDSNSKDLIYASDNFLNLETGEKQTYNDFDYVNGTIDNEGNMVLTDADHTYLYNIDGEELKIIPNLTPGTSVDYLTLTADGNHILYGAQFIDSDEGWAYELVHLEMENQDEFGESSINAEVEDTEELLGTTTANEAGEGFELHPVKDDPKAMFIDTWEASDEIAFPSDYPEKVESILNSQGEGHYGHRITLDTGGIDRTEMSYSANTYPGDERKDYCINDDLEREETVDGIDYYFYLFKNGSAELAFVKDDWCYSIEGSGFTKEEIFAVADSMKTQGKQPSTLSIDDVKFPSEIPMSDPKVTRIYDVEREDDDHNLFVDYRGEESGMTIEFEVLNEAPRGYDHDDTESIDLDNGMEGSLYESKHRLFLFDGTYYYTIQSKIDNELIQEAGGNKVLKDMFIQIGNSME